MSPRVSFGKTWWGNAWIEAMERIDYNTNRLPRGRRYANNGSVRSIDIKAGRVFAKVQGSRPRPYDIRIQLKQFNNQKIKKVKDVIVSNPAIASELSIGKLPEPLLNVLDKQNIRLLPERWDEMDADCSCPDWANPCKHLAAVYYIIAGEIDKDPFILFNLRGVAPETLTEAAGFVLNQDRESERDRDIFIPSSDIQSALGGPKSEILELPDLSFQPLDTDSLFSLLPPSPLFYHSRDFKRILLQAYKRVIEGVKSIGIIEDTPSFKGTDFYLVFGSDDVVSFISPPDGWLQGGKAAALNVPFLSDEKAASKKVKGRIVPVGDILDLFFKLPFDTAPDRNSPSSRFLNAATSIALAIARASSFIPEAVIKGDENFYIRYIPLMHDEQMDKTMNYLRSMMPLNLGLRQRDGAVLSRGGVYDVVSMILTHIVHSYARVDIRDKLCNTFFSADVYKAARFEERRTAKAVSDWLERLSIRKRDISPVIRIEASEDDRFTLHIDIENKRDVLSPLVPLSKVFEKGDSIFSYTADAVRRDISRQIAVAAEYMPHLKGILNSRGKSGVVIDSGEMGDFISHTASVLDILGIRVVIPKELKKLAMPQIAVRGTVHGKEVSYLSMEGLLDFSWEIAIGDRTISREDFLKLVQSAKGIVRFKDRYILLRPEEVKGILDRLKRPLPKPSPLEVLQSAFTGELGGMPFNPDDALKKILEDITRVDDIDMPAALNARLRPYQERGFRWLYSNAVKGFGACIADDMGLGKTIQVIALILKLKEENRLDGPALVVCPTTLIGNWHKECERFSPSLNISVYHGNERNLAREGVDAVITSYGILRRDRERFREKRWGMVVVDEAHNIKNPDTDQTKAVKLLNAGYYVAMSGTPVENRIMDLWSIFDFINKGYMGERGAFQRRYAVPIEKYRDKERIESLRRATRPFVLRRLKTDRSIIADLPEKIIFEEYCYLTKEQASLYKQVVDTVMDAIERSEGIERKGLIFKLITSLKQICNHPAHYLKKGKPSSGLSGKGGKTLELIGKILSMKEKVLVFTQYTEMGELLSEMIKDELKEDALFFHGGLPRKKRDSMVEGFQTEDSKRIMLISLKAGGTGLNLTSATNVIHYDLWWNPAVEAQATDRTYRIGQDKNVMVHRLITIGTFEEKIDEMIKRKKELADLTVATGEKWITELSHKELKEIFRLSREGSSSIKES